MKYQRFDLPGGRVAHVCEANGVYGSYVHNTDASLIMVPFVEEAHAGFELLTEEGDKVFCSWAAT